MINIPKTMKILRGQRFNSKYLTLVFRLSQAPLAAQGLL